MGTIGLLESCYHENDYHMNTWSACGQYLESRFHDNDFSSSHGDMEMQIWERILRITCTLGIFCVGNAHTYMGKYSSSHFGIV